MRHTGSSNSDWAAWQRRQAQRQGGDVNAACLPRQFFM